MRKNTTLIISGLFYIFSLSAQNIIFDNFENYDIGVFPSTWTLKYNGTGTQNQKIVDSPVKNGARAFQLEGQSSWAAEAYATPDQMPQNVTLEAWILPEKSFWGYVGTFGLGNFNVGAWGSRTSRLLFKDGKISATYQPDGSEYIIRNYIAGEWYHIRMLHDLTGKKYKVYINDTLATGNNGVEVVTEFPMHPTIETINIMLCAGNNGTTKMTFDDIKLYETTSTLIEKATDIKTLIVFPNPASDVVTIEVPDRMNATTVTIIDFTGKEILEKEITNNKVTLNVLDLQRGIYFVKANNLYNKLILK